MEKKLKKILLKKRNFLVFLSMLLLLSLQTSEVFGQETKRKINGNITDSEEQPIPGVSIVIKGTTSGVITDLNGDFYIEANDGDVLVITSAGFSQQEVIVSETTSFKIALPADITSLGEVVVVGYGTVKRKDVTGSISSITNEEIRKSQPVTVEQALQGKIPGMMVQQISGQPGGAISIQIRGISSFNGGSPLFVIDGIIIGGTANAGGGTNSMAGINPSDIESIDVLKDASATAIYGSQATNGVIIITTKRGKSTPTISYEFYTGFQQLPKKVSVMNLREYATFLNARNASVGWGFDTRPELANPEYLGEGTDWQEELFRNAPMSSHTLTVSGGDTKTSYLLSGSYSRQEGIALGSDFKRISARLNLDNHTTNWLKIGTSLQLVNLKDNVNTSNSNVIQEALKQNPDVPVTNADGTWGGTTNPNDWVDPVPNPYGLATINKNEVKRYQFFGNAYAEIAFTKELILRNEVTGNISTATEDKFEPSYTMGKKVKNENSASYNESQVIFTTLRNYLTYSHLFDNKYNLNLMAGHEAQLNKSESVYAYRKIFPSNNVQAISSGDPTTAKNSGTKGNSAMESYFGRVNLGFFDKYLLTGNIRADGSSKFAEDNRWVVNYSGALAWKINNESFLKDVKFVNEAKLRVGYGLTNNPGGRDYAYTTVLSTVPTGLTGIAQLTSQFGNSDLKWEQTKYANIGFDGAFFDWRLSFSVDFYNRRTDGLTMQIPLPMYSGTAIGYSPGSIDAPYVNVGIVNNKGFDFRISSANIRGGDFTWKTDLTVSRNINKVIKLNTDGASLMGDFSKTIEGRSIGEFYGYVIDGGVFANAEELNTHALPVKSDGSVVPVGSGSGQIWVGDLKFKDLNGDSIINELDQTFLGSPLPDYQIGLNNSFSYKNFDLNIFFSASIGNKVLNQLRITGENPDTDYGYLKTLNNYARIALIDPNGTATDINNVYVVNPTTTIAGLRNAGDYNGNNRTSDKFIEDGSYLKCKNISLGYTFPSQLTQRLHISSLRVYANVTNAFTITRYTGLDPEIGSWNPLNAGVDNGYYPQSRVFTFGVNMSLGN